jgi:hypothetical protein
MLVGKSVVVWAKSAGVVNASAAASSRRVIRRAYGKEQCMEALPETVGTMRALYVFT